MLQAPAVTTGSERGLATFAMHHYVLGISFSLGLHVGFCLMGPWADDVCVSL